MPPPRKAHSLTRTRRKRDDGWEPRGSVGSMQWFTIGAGGIERIKTATGRIRATIGAREITRKVRGLSDEQLGAFLNDVLALVDDAEGILARVREESPSKALPRPFGDR